MSDIGLPLGVLLGLLLLPWAGAFLCRREDVLSPLLLFTAFMFIGYVLPIPAFLASIDPVTTFWTNAYGEFERSFVRALWIAILGVVGFYFGYAVTRGLLPYKPLAIAPLHWRNRKLRLVGFLYTVGGLGLFGIGVVIIGGPIALVSGLSDRLSLFAGLNYLFSAINLLLVFSLVSWVRTLSQQRWPTAAFWLYTALALALAALQGSKAILFVFAFAMVLVYHTLRRRVSLAKLVLLGTLFLLILSIYTIYVREYIVLGELRSLDVTESWPRLLWLLVTTEFAGNFVQLQTLTLVVDRVPDVLDFQRGRTLLAMLTIAIPSGLYPEKYLTAPGVFTLSIDPDRWVNEGTTLPPGLIGELYMNFGAVGVLFGLIVFGAAYGWIRRLQRQRDRDPVIVTVYALAVAMMAHYVRGELVSPTVLLLIFVLPTLVMFRLVLSRQSSARSESAMSMAVGEPVH
jgi:hypothetical protein